MHACATTQQPQSGNKITLHTVCTCHNCIVYYIYLKWWHCIPEKHTIVICNYFHLFLDLSSFKEQLKHSSFVYVMFMIYFNGKLWVYYIQLHICAYEQRRHIRFRCSRKGDYIMRPRVALTKCHY